MGFRPEIGYSSSHLWAGKIPAATLAEQHFFVLFRRGGASRVVNKAKSLLSDSRIVLEAYTRLEELV